MKMTGWILVVMLGLCAFAVAQELIFTELPEQEQSTYFELCVKRGDYGLRLLQERRAAAVDTFLEAEERASKLSKIDAELRRIVAAEVTVGEVHAAFLEAAAKAEAERQAAEEVAREQAAADAATEKAAEEAANAEEESGVPSVEGVE